MKPNRKRYSTLPILRIQSMYGDLSNSPTKEEEEEEVAQLPPH
jgi:hypothetical protein